jgi:hypothetical protein
MSEETQTSVEGWCGGRFYEVGDTKMMDGIDSRSRGFYGRARLILLLMVMILTKF